MFFTELFRVLVVPNSTPKNPMCQVESQSISCLASAMPVYQHHLLVDIFIECKLLRISSD